MEQGWRGMLLDVEHRQYRCIVVLKIERCGFIYISQRHVPYLSDGTAWIGSTLLEQDFAAMARKWMGGCQDANMINDD